MVLVGLIKPSACLFSLVTSVPVLSTVIVFREVVYSPGILPDMNRVTTEVLTAAVSLLAVFVLVVGDCTGSGCDSGVVVDVTTVSSNLLLLFVILSFIKFLGPNKPALLSSFGDCSCWRVLLSGDCLFEWGLTREGDSFGLMA